MRVTRRYIILIKRLQRAWFKLPDTGGRVNNKVFCFVYRCPANARHAHALGHARHALQMQGMHLRMQDMHLRMQDMHMRHVLFATKWTCAAHVLFAMPIACLICNKMDMRCACLICYADCYADHVLFAMPSMSYLLQNGHAEHVLFATKWTC